MSVSGVRPTRVILVIWALFAVVTVAVVVTYSRLPPERLYNVTGSGFLHGGLSRALVYVNFPVGLAAVAMLLVLADRMSIERRIAAVAAVVLVAPMVSRSAIDESHLHAPWADASPAAAVAVAAVGVLAT